MVRKVLWKLCVVAAVATATEPAGAQVVVPGPYGPMVQSPHYQPSQPIVTPNVVTGVNPVTGGIDTANTQIDPSFFDPVRESSKYNGTRRWVRRPMHDQFGNQIGYQEGWVWRNSVTGVEHGELQNYTPSGLGGVPSGVHTQQQFRYPVGVHTQGQHYGPSGSTGGVHTQQQFRSTGGIHTQQQHYGPPSGAGGVHTQQQFRSGGGVRTP